MSSDPHSHRIRVLALGSPHGDDQVGWIVAQRLSLDPELAPFVHLLSSPWDVLEYLEPRCSIIVIDACHGGSNVGTVVKVPVSRLPQSNLASCSTHGGQLSDALELARRLNKVARQIVVFAIVIEVCEVGAAMSESASNAVSEAVAVIRAYLSETDGTCERDES